MRIASLGSGSRGNATLVEAGEYLLLVDCGFSLRDVRRRAERIGVDLARLHAILVTHEHSDHSSGVVALSRYYDVPVHLSHGTLSSGRFAGCAHVHPFDADSSLEFGPLEVRAVAVPHDAREPVQYCFRRGALRAGVLTDLGSVTPHVTAAFRGCQLLLLEFNHDRRMLAEGPYPPALKRRVGGAWGHLSNEQAVELLAAAGVEQLERLVVAHTSEKNNSRAQVTASIRATFPSLLPRVIFAEQEDGFPWCEVRGSASRDVVALAPAEDVGAY